MNKYTKRITPNIIEEQLKVHLELLEKAIASNQPQTIDELYDKAAEVLEKLARAQDTAGYTMELSLPYSWQRLHIDHVIGNLNDIISDIKALYNIYAAIGQSIVQGWNIAASRLGRVRNKTQLLASRVTDLNMFRFGKVDAYIWSDSFDNMTKIDVNSDLLKEDICNINDADGVVTLPLDTGADPLVQIDGVTITGNGVIGNNHEIDAEYNGDQSVLTDGNPDTWFEYEKVVTADEDDGKPLQMVLTFSLAEPKVINEVRLNPNNFGTAKNVKVEQIDTSLDGSEWLSIKDEIPLLGMELDDEENIFRLGPTTSKYSGQGIYVFLPRKAKYVRFSLSQDEPYVIDTDDGKKLRYAIGLREVEIRANKYKNVGAIISKPIELDSPVKKIYIDAAQNPKKNNKYTEIHHLISYDDGGTWHEIVPLSAIGSTEAKEVLNFNSIDDGSVDTGDIEPKKLRYKALLKRTDAAFGQSGTFREQQVTTVETFSIPRVSPYELVLSEDPIDTPVVVIGGGNYGAKGRWDRPYRVSVAPGGVISLPQYRARGSNDNVIFNLNSEDYYRIKNGTSYPLEARNPISLPFFDYVAPSGIDASDVVHSDLLPSDTSNIGQYRQATGIFVKNADTGQFLVPDVDYKINYEAGVIELPSSGIDTSKTPRGPVAYEVFFAPERVVVDEDDILYLEHPAANLLNGGLKLKAIKSVEKEAFFKLTPGKTTHKLPHRNIVRGSVKITGQTIYASSPIEFNGANTNLPNSGDWTIDYLNGYLVMNSDTAAKVGDSVSYHYLDVEVYDDTNGFETIPGYADRVKLKPAVKHPLDGEITLSAIHEDAPLEIYPLHHPSIVPGSLVFTGTDASKFNKELPFDPDLYIKRTIDERLELDSYDPGTKIAVYTLKHKVWSYKWWNFEFSNSDLFKTFKMYPLALTTDGDFQISNDGRTVSVYYSTEPTNPGTVSYAYLDPTREFSGGGYMVDYKNGILYLFDNLSGDLTVKFKYLYIVAEYDMGIQLTDKEYEVRNNKIYINGEIIKEIGVRDKQIQSMITTPDSGAAAGYGAAGVYTKDVPEDQVFITYTYNAMRPENLGELKDYFSPILRGYTLQIVTEDRMIA